MLDILNSDCYVSTLNQIQVVNMTKKATELTLIGLIIILIVGVLSCHEKMG